MRGLRATAATAVLLILGATSRAQCTSWVHELSSRTMTPRFLAGPVAWSGNILAVSGTDRDGQSFWLSTYDEEGNLLFGQRVKVRTSNFTLVNLLWNGEDFALFYRTEADHLAMVRLGTDGRMIGKPIDPLLKSGVHPEDRVDVLWSPQLDQYVIARSTSANRIALSYVQKDGKVLNETDFGASIAADSIVRVLNTSTGTLAMFYEHAASHEVTLALIENGKKGFARSVWSPGVDGLLISTRNDELVLLRKVVELGRKALRWKSIDTSGTVVQKESRLLFGSGMDIVPISLGFHDGETALSYVDAPQGIGGDDQTYRIRRLDSENLVVSDTLFAAAARIRRHELYPFDFVWTGASYISPAFLDDDSDADTYLLRLCPLSAHIDALRIARKGQTVVFTGRADGGVSTYTYLWRWDGMTATGATPAIAFLDPGDHTVTLTITDDTGTTATDSFTIFIYERKQRSVRK